MNNKYFIFVLTTVFLTIWFSWCIELEPEENYIYVVVTGNAKVWGYDDGKGELVYFPNMQIDMEIRKSGAVKKTGTFTTDENGDTIGNICHTVKVYKEQRVRVTGNLRTVLPQYYIDEGYSVSQFTYEELTWNQIKSSANWGGTYSWSPIVGFYIFK